MATKTQTQTKTQKKVDEDFVESCGNVFEDMGFSSEDARLLQKKTDLKIAIEREAMRQKLSPKQLASVLNISQSQVSDLMTGKVSKMTLDKLFKYLHRLGMKLEMKPARMRKS